MTVKKIGTEKIDLEKFKKDYDWRAAVYQSVNGCDEEWATNIYNKNKISVSVLHPINNVTHVYHASKGENDTSDWLAIVRWDGSAEIKEDLKINKYAFIAAGCDYTGWD